MLLMDKKKMITSIVGKMKDGKKDSKPDFVQKIGEIEEKEVPVVEKESDIGLETAASDIMSAVEKKDEKALVKAMKSFLELCEYEQEEDESEESED